MFFFVVYVLLGISPASDCGLPTFRTGINTMHPFTIRTSYSTSSLWRWNWQRVPKHRQTTIWRRGDTQKNMYNIQDMAKVWNQECFSLFETPRNWIFSNKIMNRVLGSGLSLFQFSYYWHLKHNLWQYITLFEVCDVDKCYNPYHFIVHVSW